MTGFLPKIFPEADRFAGFIAEGELLGNLIVQVLLDADMLQALADACSPAAT